MMSSEVIDAELASSFDAATQHSPHRRLRYHAWALTLSFLVLMASALLEVHSSTEVVASDFGFSLPAACLWQRVYGVDCPGCGLTRCFVSLAHGDVAAAWQFNPAGLLLFAFLIYQLPYRTVQIIRLARGRQEIRHDRVVFCCWAFLLILIVQWIARTFF